MLWNFVSNLIIRPQKAQYALAQLGPDRFEHDSKIYRRTDLQIRNRKGHVLECSFYGPEDRGSDTMPCVIYCHGNCGSRLDAVEAVDTLLPYDIRVFTFDFAGCGKSEGDYITLGHDEPDDIATIIHYLRNEGRTSRIGIWGRSMGAASTLVYTSRDPQVAGIVLDSPFWSLKALIFEIVASYKIKVPKSLVRLGLKLTRRKILKRAGFDLKEVVPIDAAAVCFPPALFAHAVDDTMIPVDHAHKLHKAYSGDKNLVTVEGDHNSERPDFFYDSVLIFFHNVLLQDGLSKRPNVPDIRSPLPESRNDTFEFEDMKHTIMSRLPPAVEATASVDKAKTKSEPKPENAVATEKKCRAKVEGRRPSSLVIPDKVLEQWDHVDPRSPSMQSGSTWPTKDGSPFHASPGTPTRPKSVVRRPPSTWGKTPLPAGLEKLVETDQQHPTSAEVETDLRDDLSEGEVVDFDDDDEDDCEGEDEDPKHYAGVARVIEFK